MTGRPFGGEGGFSDAAPGDDGDDVGVLALEGAVQPGEFFLAADELLSAVGQS